MTNQPKINNNLFQKNSNIALVAGLIWKKKDIPRADIARVLDLYRSTVTNITNYLITNGVVVEVGRGESKTRGGRRPISLAVNTRFGCVLGIDLKLSHYRAVLMDISGRSIWENSFVLPEAPFEKLIDIALEESLKAVKSFNIPLLGICFGLPGIIDRDRGIIRYSEPLFIQDEFNVTEYVNRKYPVSVLIENDANCCTWYEMIKSDGISDSSVVMYGDYIEYDKVNDVKKGVGIGLGLSSDGKVFRGSHSSAGEFCSSFWRGSDEGQTGIAYERIKNIPEDEGVWKMWTKDVFSSFIPLISAFDPSKFIVSGEPFKGREEFLRSIITELCPGFVRVLDRYGCDFSFDTNDEKIVARGAAMMYLNSLFSVPEISDIGSALHFEWDKVIEVAKKGNYWL